MPRFTITLAVVLLASGVTSLAAGSAAKPMSTGHWVVHDLGARVDIGTGDGGFYLYPEMMLAINERGQVVGTRQLGYNADNMRAFLWTRGRLTYLPPLPGHNRTAAVAINDGGQVVGVSWKENVKNGAGEEREHAVIWEGGKVRDLGVPADARASKPTTINARGQVVGESSSNNEYFTPSRALLWENGRMIELGDGTIEAAAINNRGEIVGSGSPPNSTGRSAFLWRGGKTLYLATPSADSAAFDINERDQIVGFLGADTPFLWASGTVHAIHHAIEFDPTNGMAQVAINGSGQVIATDWQAWILWQAGSVRSKGPGEATALNERGQVTIADSDGVARIWDKGRATRLPLLPGDDGGVALALNERDQIVGLSGRMDMTDPHDKYWKCHAVMWTWQPT